MTRLRPEIQQGGPVTMHPHPVRPIKVIKNLLYFKCPRFLKIYFFIILKNYFLKQKIKKHVCFEILKNIIL